MYLVHFPYFTPCISLLMSGAKRRKRERFMAGYFTQRKPVWLVGFSLSWE